MEDNFQGGIQTDERGRRYILNPQTGERVYVSPVAMGEQAPEDTTGIFRSRPEWNTETAEWDTPIDWGNILSLATAGGLGAGALDAAGMFSGGAGAAGGGGAMPALSTPASVLPAGGTGMIGAGGGGASAALVPAAAAGGGLSKWIGPALAAGVPTIGRMVTGSGGNDQGPAGGALSPGIMQLLAEFMRRQQQQGPLSDAVTAQAQAGLPRAR